MPEPWYQRPSLGEVILSRPRSLAAHPQLVEHFAPWVRLQRDETICSLLHVLAADVERRGLKEGALLVLVASALREHRDELAR